MTGVQTCALPISTELGFTDPNTASTADLIDFYNELEYFFQYKELEKRGN